MTFSKGDRVKVIDRTIFCSDVRKGFLGTITCRDPENELTIRFDCYSQDQWVNNQNASLYLKKIIKKKKAPSNLKDTISEVVSILKGEL